MADYINKNILCQAYIHIDPVGLSDEDIQEIKDRMEIFLSTRGKFFLYDEIEIDIQIKDGSLKKYLTIGGCIYVFLHQYADFREGVTLFYQDVKRLSESLISESLFLTKSRHENIHRTEARTGILGSLKEIVDDLNYLEVSMGHRTSEHLSKRMSQARSRTEKLMDAIKDEKDVEFISDSLFAIVSSLPAIPPPVPKKQHSPEHIKYYIAHRNSMIEFLRNRKNGKKQNKVH